MIRLYILDVDDFRPIVEVAVTRPGVSRRTVGDYVELSCAASSSSTGGPPGSTTPPGTAPWPASPAGTSSSRTKTPCGWSRDDRGQGQPGGPLPEPGHRAVLG